MSVSKLIVAAGVMAVLGVARSASAQCCLEIPPFNNEAGEQDCDDGTNQWTCPAVRAHMPVQPFCAGNGPLTCDQQNAQRTVSVFSVRCGTVNQKCVDGPLVSWKTLAYNDDCSGTCTNSETSTDTDQTVREKIKEQTLELERLSEEAKSQPKQ